MKYYWLFIAIFLIADFITTWYGVEIMGLKEQNPIMYSIVMSKDWNFLLLIKVLEFFSLMKLSEIVKQYLLDPNSKFSRLLNRIFMNLVFGISLTVPVTNVLYMFLISTKIILQN